MFGKAVVWNAFSSFWPDNQDEEQKWDGKPAENVQMFLYIVLAVAHELFQ